jgi:hypothetical protein
MTCGRQFTEAERASGRYTNHLRWRSKIYKLVATGEFKVPLVKRLFEIILEREIYVADLAEKAGVNETTLHNWTRLQNPSLANFEAALNATGYELCIRKRGG